MGKTFELCGGSGDRTTLFRLSVESLPDTLPSALQSAKSNRIPRCLTSKILTALCLAVFSSLFAQSEQPILRHGDASRINDGFADLPLAVSATRLPAEAKDLGQVPDSTPIRRIQVVLKRSAEQEKQLETLLRQQQDASSPDYHHWLTPAEFGARFGANQAEIDGLTGWLTAQGFGSIHVNAGRTVVELSGPASAVRSAFQTSLHSVSFAGGTYYANVTAATVPKSFASLIAGVRSLNNLPGPSVPEGQTVSRDSKPGLLTKLAASPSLTDAKPEFTYTNSKGGTVYGLGPYDFAAIYNVLPLWNASSPIDGTGQSIAVAGDSTINPTDFANFRTLFSLPLGNTDTQTGTQYLSVVVNGPTPQSTVDEFHGDSDTQWAAAVAKNATILYVTSESTEASSGVDLSAEYIVDNNLAGVLVDTFTSCELKLGSSGNAFYNSLWQQASAQGITVVTAAGDSGNAGCDVSGGPPATHGFAVNGIASTPYDVAVGGTEFYAPNALSQYFSSTNASTGSSAKGYIPEDVWNDSCTNPTLTSQTPFMGLTPEQACNALQAKTDGLVAVAGGGGGASSCTNPDGGSCSGGYAKPAWQAVPGVPADGARDLPDVSFFASKGREGSSYVVCDQDLDPNKTACSLKSPYQNLQAGGGTEIAAAAFAGVMALASEEVGERIGNPNIVLYTLANRQASAGTSCDSTGSPDSSCFFHDITMGSNEMVCATGSTDCVTSTAGDAYGILTAPPAAAGYDLASGLGSVNVANLVSSWIVVPQPTTAVLAINPAKFVHGSPANVQVSVMGNAPTGQVSINAQVDNGSVGTGSLTNGSFAGVFRNFPGGSYGVQAHYEGDTKNAPSDSNFVSVTVSPEPSTTKLSVIAYDPVTGTSNTVTSAPYGTNIFVRADVAGASGAGIATGSVTFLDSGTQLPNGVYRLNSESYTEAQENFFSVGSHDFTASYGGDASFNASQSGQAPLTITRGPTRALVLLSSATVSAAGTVTFTGVVDTQSYSTAAAPTGTMTFMAGSKVLGTAAVIQGYGANSSLRESLVHVAFPAGMLALGVNQITASYAGDTNYLPSSSTSASITVTSTTLAPTITSLTVTPTVVAYGNTFILTATVSPNSPVPTGSIYFEIDGGSTGAPVPLSASGTASITLRSASYAGGQYQATAIYSGDTSNYRSSASAPVTFTISSRAFTVAKVVANPTTAVKGTFISIDATVFPATATPTSPTPTGTVQLVLDGAAYGVPFPLVQGVARLPLVTTNLQVGVHTISAYYAGDSIYYISSAKPITITILAAGLNGSNVAVSNLPAQVVTGTALPFTASVTPTNPTPTGVYQIILDSGYPGAPILLTGLSQQLSLDTSSLSLGDHTLSVFYSGDSYYASSTSAPQTFTVIAVPMGATFTLTPASTTLSQGRLGTSNPIVPLALTAVNGFNAAVTLSCSTLPANTNCVFASPSLTVSGTQPLQDQWTIALDTGVKGKPLVARTTTLIPGLTFAGLLCILFRRKGYRRIRALAFLLLLTAGMIAMQGCGSGYAAGLTPTGTYAITVTATGGGITQTATLNLTIF